MQVWRPILQNIISRQAAAVSRAAYHGGHHKETTMNDLPVPEGDWNELNEKRQRKYNAVLIGGILMFGITMTVAKESGLIHLNFSPPKSYE